jgi:hypothetical protein
VNGGIEGFRTTADGTTSGRVARTPLMPPLSPLRRFPVLRALAVAEA